MVVKELSEREFKAVYRLYFARDFARAEIKPLRQMEKLRKAGICTALGLYDETGLTAYAYLLRRADSTMRLLDYFAVCGERGKGYGSIFLASLKKLYEDETCLIAEVETPDAEGIREEEVVLRHRRKTFYARNGWDPSPYRTKMFDAELDVMTLPLGKPFTDAEVKEELSKLYPLLYPRAYRRGKVALREVGCEPDFIVRTSVRGQKNT